MKAYGRADASMSQRFAGQLLGLLANVTVLTALLYYFGWRRAETQAARMGFDESILGMTTRDYVLRSIGPVLPLLLAIAAAGLVFLWADPRVTALVRGGGWAARWLPWIAAAVAVLLPVVVHNAARWWFEGAYAVWPLALGAGVLLLVYAEQLRRRRTGMRTAYPGLLKVCVFLAVGVCLFWSASNQAEILGNNLADRYAHQVAAAVGVTVYSQDRLYLDDGAEGVTEEVLAAGEGRYRYRYRGLRLLDHINDRYFLVPDGWTPQRSVVIALTDSDDLRFEFHRGSTPTPRST